MQIQTRTYVDVWTRGSANGAITPITTAALLIPVIAKGRLLDSASFYNGTGGSITVTLYLKKSGVGTAPGIAFWSGAVGAGLTVPVPVALPNLEASDGLYALASATALTYSVNYRTE